MRRTRTALVDPHAVLAVASAGCGGDDEDTTVADTETTAQGDAGSTLMGTVGPGYTISLQTSAGDSVESLVPGEYTIEVDDRSGIHNFHLSGPGVDEATDVGGSGAQAWNVTLVAGDYSFVCDPHAGQMNGEFAVA